MKTPGWSATHQFQKIDIDGWNYHFEICLDFQGHILRTPKDNISQIAKDVFPSTANAFQQSESEMFYTDVHQHIKDSDSLLICYQGSTVVGFASFKDFYEIDTLFVNGIAIHSEHQGCGIAGRIIDALTRYIPRSKLALTTQNPCMYQVVRNRSVAIIPSEDMSVFMAPEDVVRYSRLIAGRKGKYNPQTSVIEDLYTSCLYPSIPRCRDEKINLWWDQMLGVENGQTSNGALVIGILK